MSCYIYNPKKNSTYWMDEIDRVQTELKNLNDTSEGGVLSVKNDNDSVTYQSLKDKRESLLSYLAYCESQYNLAKCHEDTDLCCKKPKGIYFFPRSEYGY